MCTKNLFKITSFLQCEPDGRPKTWFANTGKHADIQEYKPPYYSVQKLPCGQCVECKMEYSKQWAFRCVEEAKKYEDNIMMTLTYNDEEVPRNLNYTKVNEITGEVEEVLTLRKKDHQDFMKRLRKAYGNGMKFYMCGEYGSQTHRPHYHIICFNLKIDDLKPYKSSKTEYGTHLLYKSAKIDKIWGKGFVDLNEVNYETCAYVSRYVTKKQGKGKSKEWYEEKGLVPEYTCMSKGIGKDFYFENKEKLYEKKTIWQKTQKGLRKITPGRYYDNLMKAENPEKLEEIKKERAKRAQEKTLQLLLNTSLTLDEYIEQKHSINESKNKKLKRA